MKAPGRFLSRDDRFGCQNDVKNRLKIYQKSIKKRMLKMIPDNVQKSLKSDAPDFGKSSKTCLFCLFDQVVATCPSYITTNRPMGCCTIPCTAENLQPHAGSSKSARQPGSAQLPIKSFTRLRALLSGKAKAPSDGRPCADQRG